MKTLIKRFFPFLLPLALIPEFLVDYLRYVKHSGVLNVKKNEITLKGKIIAEYHVIEKGLTMPETRLGFGKLNLLSLIEHCLKYVEVYGFNDDQVNHAISVVFEYRDLHIKNGYELDKDVSKRIFELEEKNKLLRSCEQFTTTSKEYFNFKDDLFPMFSKSRRSIRNYSKADVPLDEIKEAIELAQSAPSSCNRQGISAYVFTDPAQVCKILTLQGGNKGFGHLANKLIVVVGDLGVSHGVYERHQAFVDGGIFSMNLLYGLHYKKIAACPLNCNFSYRKDALLRKICGIKKSEVFIMMISCGYLPDEIKIASSPRYPVEKIMHIK